MNVANDLKFVVVIAAPLNDFSFAMSPMGTPWMRE